MFSDETALNFNLDQYPGVANTFDLPTFDYQTMLSHNIYFNLNSKGPLNVDDGNKSVLRTNSVSQTKVYYQLPSSIPRLHLLLNNLN